MRAVAEGRTYRFEPLQRGGLLLGLSAGQLGLVAGSVLVAFVAVKELPGVAGWGSATAAVGLAGASCRPVLGRSPLQWAEVACSYLLRPKRQILAPPVAVMNGRTRVTTRRGAEKTFAAGVYLQEAVLPHMGPVGVLTDERSGTAAALLRARGGPFCLLDEPAKQLRTAAWAGLLESVANQRSAVAALQWCQRAVPVAGRPLRRPQPPDEGEPLLSSGSRAPAGLPDETGFRSWHHETFLVVALRAPSRRRLVPRETAVALGNELAALRSQLHAMGIACDGPLDARGCAAAIGASLVPGLGRHSAAHPWPLSTEEHWSEVRADGYWHRVYWVAEWPRAGVGPDFLSPLLVARAQRCFSVVMAPVPPERAARDAESSRTAQLADAKLRAQGGFLETARQRRRAEAVQSREAELADGRGSYRFAGYVAVSAPSMAELDRCCGELERSAGAAQLCLRPLYGQQREGLSWALPFGRGV